MTKQSGRTVRMPSVPARLDDTIREESRPKRDLRECLMLSEEDVIQAWPNRPTVPEMWIATPRVVPLSPMPAPAACAAPALRGPPRPVEPMKQVVMLSPQDAAALREAAGRRAAALPTLVVLVVTVTIAAALGIVAAIQVFA